MVRRVVRTKAEWTLVPIARSVAWSRESYDGIIGDAPTGAIPLRRVATFRGSLRRHVYLVGVEGMMSQRTPEQRETGRAVPAEPERGGH